MWKLWILSMLVAGIVSDTPPNFCCQEGSVLLKRKNVCWEPKSNKTSVISSLLCKQKVRIIRYLINSDGNLVLMGINRNVTSDRTEYCVSNTTTIVDKELKNATEVALVCHGDEGKIVADEVSGYCMIISVIFLFLTALIYCALPELRDLQGKSIISFCCSMGLAMLILVIMKLVPYSDMNLCAVRGFLAYFFAVSSFFWTNAISIQILLCIRRPSTMNYEWKDFAWYATYACGVPALLTLIMALVNFLPGDHQRPGIGLNHCWFYDTTNQWYYMYSIMSILIIANICIFVYTSISLWRNTFATTHLKALRYKFILTIRLFVLMGITWIFEMISSVVEENIFWVVMDIFNTLQGLLIFLVLVVFRRRTIKAMYRHGWLDCVAGPIERYLAVGNDEEQDVIEHTKDVPMEDK